MKEGKNQEDPPFRFREERYTYGPEQDRVLVIEIQRRGFLRDEVFRMVPPQPFKPDSRRALSVLCHMLRTELDRSNLPTDEWPVMPIELDFGYVPEEHGIIADEDLWIGVAEDSTEPLTKNRITAELLHTVLRILNRPGSDEYLTDIHRVMKLFSLYSIAGELNSLAIAGQLAREARAKGPRSKIAETREARLIVVKIAQSFWAEHPKYRGHFGKTAQVIADDVNKLRRTLAPNCKPLAAKTIADNLSGALGRKTKKQTS
jgi:hypothetical protein